jgi:hypothetical protein
MCLILYVQVNMDEGGEEFLMVAKQRKLLSLHFVLIVVLLGGLSSVRPAEAITPTSTSPNSYQPLYLSLAGGQTIAGIAVSDEDILRFDGKNWRLYFEGSDVGVGSVDLSAFAILDAGTILMSFDTNVTVHGINATPQDVLRFEATSLGGMTDGAFSLYFDGSDVGLADAINEKIDSLTRLPDGRLLISTNGNPSVPGISGGRDEDVLAFMPASLGRATRGTWSLYFDGSDVGLAEIGAEDIDAMDVRGGKVYLSTQGDFSVNGILGADEDVFVCTVVSLGGTTACNYSPGLYFDGSTWGLSANDVDAFHFRAAPTPTPSATASPVTVTPTATFCPKPTPEHLQVEPVISPTNHSYQVITVRISNGDSATVTSESGTYTVTGNFSSYNPALVNVPLLSNTTHHLTVSVHVPPTPGPGGCPYGNYTLRTGSDRFGAPLTIVQTTATHTPSATPGGNTLTLSPIADSYVNAADPTVNYGSSISLQADAYPDVRSYLRFHVQGLTSPITKATLRMFSGSSSSLGYQIHGVSNTTWSEDTLTYNNAPAVGELIGSSGEITVSTWTTVDLTSHITGNGVFDLALTSASYNALSFFSRESSYNRPELVIETQSGTVSMTTFTPGLPMGANGPMATKTPTPSPTAPAP